MSRALRERDRRITLETGDPDLAAPAECDVSVRAAEVARGTEPA
jgi:hypothetical protein